MLSICSGFRGNSALKSILGPLYSVEFIVFRRNKFLLALAFLLFMTGGGVEVTSKLTVFFPLDLVS